MVSQIKKIKELDYLITLQSYIKFNIVTSF